MTSKSTLEPGASISSRLLKKLKVEVGDVPPYTNSSLVGILVPPTITPIMDC